MSSRVPVEQTSPPPDGTVAHLGGGRSARLAAVAVAVALGLVVWVGASGRSPAPPAPPPSSAAEVADASNPTPDLSAAPSSAALPALPNDVFSVSVQLGVNGYTAILDEEEPGHLSGRLRISLPLPEPADEANLVFHQLSAPWAPGRPVQIGQWPMDLIALYTLESRVHLVVNRSVSADTRPGDVPRPEREGFWIRAGLHTVEGVGTVEIDVRVGANQVLQGRYDGVFGPHGDAPEVEPAVQPARVDYPRDRGLYNRCRWDISPYSGKPIPGTDEAEC